MTVMMIRAKVNADNVAEVEAAVEQTFAAIEKAQPAGVRYASTKLDDGVTFVVLLSLENTNNPLETIPEFVEFQTKLKGWIVEPPTAERLAVVGSYRLF
jgi:dihydropteroate synthase